MIVLKVMNIIVKEDGVEGVGRHLSAPPLPGLAAEAGPAGAALALDR